MRLGSRSRSITLHSRYLSEIVNLQAVFQSCSVKEAFLEISQNSYENTSARVSF